MVGDESGQASLFMNLDDASPNAPGSRAVSLRRLRHSGHLISRPPSSATGIHGEGATCVPLDCVNAECPTTPTPTRGATNSDTDTHAHGHAYGDALTHSVSNTIPNAEPHSRADRP